MTPSSQQSRPSIFLSQQSQNKEWVRSSYDPMTGFSKSKLLFNEAIPASTSNRASSVNPPAPIVIERLTPLPEVPETMQRASSSLSITALSVESLQAAVKLAKRDVRHGRLHRLAGFPVRHSEETSLLEKHDVEPLQELPATKEKTKSRVSTGKGMAMQPSTKRHLMEKHPTMASPWTRKSPPTRDPGPWPVKRGKEATLSHEMLNLQRELELYVCKVQELVEKAGEKQDQPLDAEEQAKLEDRRKKQAACSARTLYVLQQQVREVQEEIERIQSQKTSNTQKTTALDRLAATHRSALRTLQVFNQQLSMASQGKVPPHHKQLGQLIRQLSLSSYNVEVDQDSDVLEIAFDILQKLETLDSALSKHDTLEKLQAQACLLRRKSPPRSMSPAPRGPRTPGNFTYPRGRVHGRRVASQMLHGSSQQPTNRREVLRAAVDLLIQQRELRKQHKPAQKDKARKKGLHPDVMKGAQVRDGGFQQPTISSRLRVNELPQKESYVPWKPTSPHSPPLRCSSPQKERAEPRCLFSPVKASSSLPALQTAGGLGPELTLNSLKKKYAESEALRKAWLDRMTIQRLEELERLRKEEDECIKKLRSDVALSNQWAEQAEQKPREPLQPLQDKVQEADSSEKLSDSVQEDLLDNATRVAWAAEMDRRLEDMAQCTLHAPTLESMLLRMEEIQKDQEEVRRRFTSITYSDPLYLDRLGPTGSLSHAPASRTASPQPIKLIKTLLEQTSTADIVLEKPVETGFQSKNSMTQEEPQDERQPRSGAVFSTPKKGKTVLSVPGSVLGNIRQYREDYDSSLRAAAHQQVGSLNPWTVAESVADELLSEALADVAAEFQDVMEQYAAAVFTSEFLQPLQTPARTALGQ